MACQICLGRSDIWQNRKVTLEVYNGVIFKCDVETFVSLNFPALTKDYEEKSLLDSEVNSNWISENVGILCEIYLASTFCKEAYY